MEYNNVDYLKQATLKEIKEMNYYGELVRESTEQKDYVSLERISGVTLPNKLILIEKTTYVMLDEDTALIEIQNLKKETRQ